MFKIFDGRNHFFQWDKERKLIVEDKSINQVHFCNRTGECSLIREVYELDGLRVVDVPEVILTEAWRIHVYGYDINHTKYEEVFEVKQRTRPDDYVYGEEELRSWDELIQKVEQIEREGFTDEQVEKAIEGYLEENPIDVEGYVSDEELDAAIANLATQEYVDEQISAIPQVDLKGYATEKYVDDAVAAVDINVDLSEYAKKSDIPSTSGLATEKYVDNKVSSATGDFYTKVAADSRYAFKTEIPDTTGMATKKYVDDKIANLDIPEADVDLSNYYTKAQVDESIQTVYTTMDSLQDDFAAKENTYTKDEVDDAISSAIGNIEIPEGQATEEVYVGVDEPTDVNVKLWVNPEEEEEKYTTEADVIALIEQYGGGGEVLPSAEGVEF